MSSERDVRTVLTGIAEASQRGYRHPGPDVVVMITGMRRQTVVSAASQAERDGMLTKHTGDGYRFYRLTGAGHQSLAGQRNPDEGGNSPC